MADRDWKSVVRTVAPTIATALGTPLLGTAVGVLSELFFGKKDASEAEVAEYINKGVPPDTLAKLKEMDLKFKLDMEQLGFNLNQLEADTERAYLADVQNARAANAGNKATFWMGVFILLTFLLLMAGVLWMCYAILVGSLAIKDPSIVAVVFTLIGTIVGYVASNAQTVVNFEFGTSRGSAKKSDDMADAVKSLAGAKR